jgi:hypothetical protein
MGNHARLIEAPEEAAQREHEGESMIRVRWSERPRAHRWAIVGASVGMSIGAIAVFQYAFHGSTFDRWLIMVAGLLGGGAVGLLLAKVTTR